MARHYTYRIRVSNRESVQAEVFEPGKMEPHEPSGTLQYTDGIVIRINELQRKAREGSLAGSEVDELGELLFSVLFDQRLRHDFFIRYDRARRENALMRLELDMDERQLPDLAALPWEFMRVPSGTDYGTVWLGTSPDITLSRRRALWTAPPPLKLKARENLRIALAVAMPKELGAVRYEEILEALRELARTERIELLGPVQPANKSSIDDVLGKQPHILHFIGHGRLKDQNSREIGEIALVGPGGFPHWVDASEFSELFNRHQPGVVVLQACESGMLSASQAFAGIASHVVRQHIPVVVAMQYEVSNATARRFVLEFYSSLANGNPVDKAVQEGRRKVAMESPGYEKRDFATPVLFMRVRDGHLFHREVLTSSEIAKLTENARKMEQNEAYDEAIKTWKEIRASQRQGIDVEEEIRRLEAKSIRANYTRDILKQLSRRVAEIKPIYMPVVRYIQRQGREGVDEDGKILMDAIGSYVSGELSPEGLIDLWSVINAQPFQPVVRYDILAERLNRGEIIPFLGSEVIGSSNPIRFQAKELAQKLAKEVGYRDFSGTFPLICQYYQMTEPGRSSLLKTMKSEVESTCTLSHDDPLYRLLGSVESPIMIISSSYDDQLETVFREKAKKHVVISHTVHLRTEHDFGRIVVKYSEGPTPEETCTAETISERSFLEKGYSIIYKICGSLGLCFMNRADALDPLLLSEDDFLMFFKYLERLVPDYLVRQFSRRNLLFLGYDLEEWHDRLIASSILEKKRANRELSYAVRENPTPFERAYWKFNGVDIYETSLHKFVSQLNERLLRLKNEN